jgi:dCMP deaminase
MRLAYLAATRATCARKHVGSIIVDPYHRVVSTGYNGAPAGLPSCDDIGHEMVENHCVRTLHAESNAIDSAGPRAIGCTLYCTVTLCYDCAKRAANSGIVRIVWDEFYASRYGKSNQVEEFLRSAGIEVEQWADDRMTAFKNMLSAIDDPTLLAPSAAG